jgi:rRNA maturation protein Nop10
MRSGFARRITPDGNEPSYTMRPTLRAGGRAGALPRPRGFSPVERFLPSAFSCQVPRPPLTQTVSHLSVNFLRTFPIEKGVLT